MWGFSDLKEIASLIESSAYAREVRRIVRAIRLTMILRRKLKATVLSGFLNYALNPGSEVHTRLSSYLPKVIYGFAFICVFHLVVYSVFCKSESCECMELVLTLCTLLWLHINRDCIF